MSKIRRPTVTIPLPKPDVKSVLARIGSNCGALGRPYTSTPYWSHAILDWAIGYPNFLAAGLPIKINHGTSCIEI